MSVASSAVPLIALGAGAGVTAVLLRSRAARGTEAKSTRLISLPEQRPVTTAPSAAKADGRIGVWVMPVPSLGDRRPIITNSYRSPRTARAVGKRAHLGVDILFRRRSKTDLVGFYPAGSPNGTPAFFMPDGIPALAASAGRVRFAQWTPQGYTVVIEHPNGWATYYTHLASLAVARGDQVDAGEPVGIIGASPKDGERLKHLHFELWRGGKRSGAVDPARYFAAWGRQALPSWSPPAGPVRNAGLTYRPVGARSQPYPDWVRQLKGSSGVYVIRQDGEVVYVGQSSAGRLYETLTRHLQGWRRSKGFWRGQYAEGHDPGLTYDRRRVEVAVKVTSPTQALDEEARLIERLSPRDNVIGQPVNEDIPF